MQLKYTSALRMRDHAAFSSSSPMALVNLSIRLMSACIGERNPGPEGGFIGGEPALLVSCGRMAPWVLPSVRDGKLSLNINSPLPFENIHHIYMVWCIHIVYKFLDHSAYNNRMNKAWYIRIYGKLTCFFLHTVGVIFIPPFLPIFLYLIK